MTGFNGIFLFPAQMDILGTAFRKACSGEKYDKVVRDLIESSDSLNEEVDVITYLDGFESTIRKFITMMDNYDDAGAIAFAQEVAEKSSEPGALADLRLRGGAEAAKLFSRRAIQVLGAN